MEQGFSCSTPAFRNTDILEGICRKKSNVICNLVPLGCELHKLQLRNIRLAAAAAAAAQATAKTAPALIEDTVHTHISQDFYSSYPT